MSHTKKPLVYYITAHGYGHGVRSCDILRAVHRMDSKRPLIVVSDLPESFLRNRMPGVGFEVRPGAFDVGMVQRDSVRVDVNATRDQLVALLKGRPALREGERDFLRACCAGAVVCDIPAIPLEAAAGVGVPALATGNFSWSWIYAEFIERDPVWRDVVEAFTEGYRKADLLMRMPFSEEMTVFPHRIDVPVIAEPSRARREDLAGHTGAPSDRRWVLLSFSSLDWDDVALDRVAGLEAYAFFTVRPLAWSRPNIFPVDRNDIPFPEVLASVDAVVTKPGFGIVSECVANRKPMLYVERTDFLEYPVLEQAVRRYVRHQHIPSVDLYRGDLGMALDRLWMNPEPVEIPPMGGADVAARCILDNCRD